MRSRSLLAAFLGMVLSAPAVSAQIGFPPGGGTSFPGGRGGRGGGRGGAPRWDGGAMPDIPDLSNPVRLILQHRADLQLADSQAQKVDSVAAALDRQNDTLVAQVRRALGEDSLRADAPGERTPGDPGEAIALRDRLKTVQPAVKLIQKNDDAAWKRATTLLTGDQRKQADKIRKDDRKQQQQERSRWRGGGGRGRYPG